MHGFSKTKIKEILYILLAAAFFSSSTTFAGTPTELINKEWRADETIFHNRLVLVGGSDCEEEYLKRLYLQNPSDKYEGHLGLGRVYIDKKNRNTYYIFKIGDYEGVLAVFAKNLDGVWFDKFLISEFQM